LHPPAHAIQLASFPGCRWRLIPRLQVTPHSQAAGGTSFPGYRWHLIPRLQGAPHSQAAGSASFPGCRRRLISRLQVVPHSQAAGDASFPGCRWHLIPRLQVAPHSQDAGGTSLPGCRWYLIPRLQVATCTLRSAKLISQCLTYCQCCSWVYLFRAHSGYIRHETFSFMMSLPAMSLGLRFCMSKRAGQAEVGGYARRVQTASPHLGSSLEATGLALGRPFLSFLAYMELNTSNLTL